MLVILGREHEKQAVEAVLASARDGGAASLLLVGLPGIGKTTLLDHAEGVAATGGMTAYRITAVEAESGIPGSGLSLLRPLLGDGNLSDPWNLLRSVSDLAAQRPLLLVLDDVHWLDEASIAALSFMLRRLDDDAVAVLMAARPEIDDPPRLADVARVAVEPLPRMDSVALLRAVSPTTPEPLADRLAAALGDVPLALVEAPSILPADVLAGTAPMPVTLPVGRSVASRYARGVDAMPEAARRALVLAATEDTGDPAVLAQALLRAGLDADALLPAVDAGLVLPGTEVQFRHPLVRAAVHSSATEEERRSSHAVLAEVHAAAGDEEMRLRHLAAATVGADEELAAALEAIVPDVAARRGVVAASDLAARAAAFSPRPEDRWRRLVLSLELGKHQPQAVPMAWEVVERCSDPQLRARAAAVLSWEHLPAEEARALSRQALDWVGRGATASELLATSALWANEAFDFPGLADVADRLRAWDRDRPLDADDLTALAYTTFQMGETAEGLAALRRAHAIGFEFDLDSPHLDNLWGWVTSLDFLGEIAWDEEPLAGRKRTACAILRRAREPRWAALADTLDATEALDRGEHVRALGILRNLRPLVSHLDWLDVDLLEMISTAEARRGDVRATRDAVQEFLAECRRMRSQSWSLRANYCRGLVHLLVGRPDNALEALSGLDRSRSTDPRVPRMAGFPLRVEALAALGRTDDARAVARELERCSDGLNGSRMRMWVELSHALAATDDVDARFVAAVGHGRSGQYVWELARTLLLQGEWLRRSRRPVDARDPLREAAFLFRQTDAVTWAERAERALAATGEAPVTARAGATVDLTPQELRIALAVADGLSNNEIASTVFLSVKTVETHLTRIYRKLGVRSRGGVAKALADAGVTAGSTR